MSKASRRVGSLLFPALIVLVLIISLLPVPVQATTPAISSVTTSVITETGAIISWTTNINATSNIEYGLTAAYGSSAPTVADTTADNTSHAVILFSLTANTTYHYRVISSDGTDTATSPDYAFTTKAFTISSIAASSVTHNSATITWTTSVSATGNVEYGTTTSYDSAAPSPADTSADNTSHIVVLSGLNPSTTYHYKVKSTDSSSNEEVSEDKTFNTAADTTAPTISGIAVSSSQTTATITWNTDEPATSQVEYGTTAAYGTTTTEDTTMVTGHSVVLSGLSPNTTYHYLVKSKDSSNNNKVSSVATFATTADTTAPTISITPVTGIGQNTATINWTTNEPATSNLEYGNTLGGPYPNTAPSPADITADKTSHSVVLSSLTPGVTYYYKVKSKDASNNETTSGEYSFTTAADGTPPTISVKPVTGIGQNTATINWTTNEPATSNLEYGLTTAYGTSAPATADTTADKTSHSILLSGLTPGTTYHFRVKSKDSSNNETISADYTLTTNADTTPPTLSSGPSDSSVTQTTATINWTTNELATSQVVYSTYSHSVDSYTGTGAADTAKAAYGAWSYEDATLVTNHGVTLSGLSAGITYYYRVISKDASGNTTVSAESSFSTTADTTPPAISTGPVDSGVTSTSATIDWTTDEASDSLVEYGTGIGYGSSTILDPTSTKSHSVLITGLTPGTTYHYQVKSKDSSGNEIVSGDFTFSTALDTTPPPVPALLLPSSGLISTETNPTLDWSTIIDIDNASTVTYSIQIATDSGFLSSVVYLSGLSASIHTLTTALADGTYYWHVKADDGNGNSSSWTAAWSFTVDTTGPVVNLTALSPDPTNDNTPTFTGTVTDAYSIISAVQYRYDSGTWMIASATDGTFNSLSEGYTLTVPALGDGSHTVDVRAQDNLGNWTDVSGYSSDSFNIDTASPTITIINLDFHPATPLATPTFEGTVTDTASAVSSVEYRILSSDGTIVEINWTVAAFTAEPGNPKTGTYTLTTSTLTEGYHLLQVRATDAAGNTGDTSYNSTQGFNVTLKPVVKMDAESPMSADSPMWVTDDYKTRDTASTFKGEAESGGLAIVKVQCRIDGGIWTDATFTPTSGDNKKGTWEFTPASLSDGQHTLQVKAIDAAGDETPAEVYAEGAAGYISFTVDTTPPVISNVRVTDITPTSAVITWTTDEPTTGKVEFGKGIDYGSIEEDTTPTTEHSVKITGLSGSFLFFSTSEYHFRVTSTDDVGNTAQSGDGNFTTSSPIWAYIAVVFGALIILAIILAIAFGVIRRLL